MGPGYMLGSGECEGQKSKINGSHILKSLVGGTPPPPPPPNLPKTDHFTHQTAVHYPPLAQIPLYLAIKLIITGGCWW